MTVFARSAGWPGTQIWQITAGNTDFLSIALIGWDTNVYYGTFGGPLISLAGNQLGCKCSNNCKQTALS